MAINATAGGYRRVTRAERCVELWRSSTFRSAKLIASQPASAFSGDIFISMSSGRSRIVAVVGIPLAKDSI